MHKADRAAVVREVLQEAGIEVQDKDAYATDVLADDGQPRFQWTTLPVGDAGYQDSVFAAVIQRRAWREQYEHAKRATGRASPPVETRSATTHQVGEPAA
jgi:8-oxo-dGTP pyrophosphatase MutT (NUDIX family)